MELWCTTLFVSCTTFIVVVHPCGSLLLVLCHFKGKWLPFLEWTKGPSSSQLKIRQCRQAFHSYSFLWTVWAARQLWYLNKKKWQLSALSTEDTKLCSINRAIQLGCVLIKQVHRAWKWTGKTTLSKYDCYAIILSFATN